MGESRSGNLVQNGVAVMQERAGSEHEARAGPSRELVVKLSRVDASARRENGKKGFRYKG